MIAVAGLRRAWGDFSLAVSFAVTRGEYLVVLGPSGCGKSLLLGTLAGLFAPEQGVICLDDRDVTRAPPEARGVGLVFQRSALFPHLSVSENIAFGLRSRKVPRAERRARVAELVRALGIGALLDHPVAGLSGGEAQKVAIARALAPRPAILLLDEPLSLVDHNARLELRDELRRLHRALQLTVLHVTHDREEARALGSRCAVMQAGRIVQLGPTAEVFEQPRCLFVARFLGRGELTPPPPGCSEPCLAGAGACDRPQEQEVDRVR